MPHPPRIIWAYSYRLVPPLPVAQLRKVKALLEQEHRDAVKRDATWEGRLVVDERIAHILVLSDTPDLDLAANHRIEAALRAVDAGYAVTVPLAVPNEQPLVASGESDIPQEN